MPYWYSGEVTRTVSSFGWPAGRLGSGAVVLSTRGEAAGPVLPSGRSAESAADRARDDGDPSVVSARFAAPLPTRPEGTRPTAPLGAGFFMKMAGATAMAI